MHWLRSEAKAIPTCSVKKHQKGKYKIIKPSGEKDESDAEKGKQGQNPAGKNDRSRKRTTSMWQIRRNSDCETVRADCLASLRLPCLCMSKQRHGKKTLRNRAVQMSQNADLHEIRKRTWINANARGHRAESLRR
jgi:hypothetical protein